jgi:hypothetical protein
MIMVAYRHGLRVSELVHLRWFRSTSTLTACGSIVLLDLVVVFTWGSNLHWSARVLADIRHRGHCLCAGSGSSV